MKAPLIGALLGLAVYEILAQAAGAGLVPFVLAQHLPTWELFYVSFGLCAGALYARRRLRQPSTKESSDASIHPSRRDALRRPLGRARDDLTTTGAGEPEPAADAE